jgi:ABC-2 type transport system permease protein
LGLLPLDRDTILRAKFLFAAAGSLVPCSLLILVSDLMLNISTDMLLVHQITCFSLCCGLSGIAVGLGAVMPDLRESSPSKIAAGFGGTLNLVVSALYIMLLVLLTALPWHLKMADDQGLLRDLGGPLLQVIGSNEGIVGGAIATLVIGVVATAWPLRVGMRAFRRLEF